MLFKLSNLNSNFALTLGYLNHLNPALNNSALICLAKHVISFFVVIERMKIESLAAAFRNSRQNHR